MTTDIPSPIGKFHATPPPIHLSSTNNIPSETETSDTGRTINEARGYLSHLDSEIDRLRKALDACLVDRKRVIDHIEQHHAILSPLRKFPSEMLQEIFLQISPEPPSSTAFTYPPSNTRSPWNFSRVCSRWRALSISLPALWSNFIISSTLSPSGIVALAVQLQRSDPYPLTISLMIESIDIGVLRLLVENSSRWQTLHFRYLSTQMIQALNEIPGCRLPELRSLRLRLDCTINPTTRVFENSPKLREVFIHGDVHELVPFPLQQLTRLRIGITRTPHRLASARNLRELTLNALPETPDNPIELPVRMLVVDRSSILDSLLLPELEDLCILGECPRASALIRRSECHLQRLTLEYSCTTEEGIAMLEALPNLHELHWEGDSVIFSRMAIPVSPAPDLNPLVPKLRSMSLFHYQPFRDATITDLMESRRRSTAHATLSLRVLDLTDRYRDIEVFDIEKDFRRRGIDVEWFHGDFADRRYRDYLRRYP